MQQLRKRMRTLKALKLRRNNFSYEIFQGIAWWQSPVVIHYSHKSEIRRTLCACTFHFYYIYCYFKDTFNDTFRNLQIKNAKKSWFIRLFSVPNSRGWENRTPTKGFGDPYHTIWPIPCIIKIIANLSATNQIIADMLKFVKRRWRDLNPRTGYPIYRISSADPSATWVHLHVLKIVSNMFII